ncbi:MAG: DUF1576 domain-containing protein [Defluviitaleaceae bacterium]|nr:DUF1576 domain-containing protein [Defluviitaleaceae bacterium]
MKKILSNPYNLTLISLAYFFVFGLIIQPLDSIFYGFVAIMQAPDVLTTDYLYIGGFGTALINASITGFITFGMLKFFKHDFKSGTISNIWLVIGFSLFGKNPLNILPIWFGGWLFCKFMRQDFNKTILVVLVATSLGPVVTVPWSLYLEGVFTNLPMAIGLSIVFGMFIGFIFEPIAANMIKVHDGFNLYNGGLTAGIMAIVLSAAYQSFGIYLAPVSYISTVYHYHILVFLLILSLLYIGVGLYLNPGSVRQAFARISEMNKTKNDYFTPFGTLVYLNMGLLGILGVVWAGILGLFWPGGFILHGPAMAAILSTFGFGANGKNVPSSVSLYIGVMIASITSPAFGLGDPGIITILFFVTCLCPIPTKFGYRWGIVAGFLHVHFATSLAGPAGGMNLYNNGLAAGFVAILLYPLIMAFVKRKENAMQ